MEVKTARIREVVPEVALCVLLSGGIRAAPLSIASGQSVLDLSVSPDATVGGAWIRTIARISLLSQPQKIMIVHGGPTPAPGLADAEGVSILRDEDDFRGPAGAVRDAAGDQPDDSYVLVIEAASYMQRTLDTMFASLDSCHADVVVAINADRSPAGVYLIRRRVIDLIPVIGFMDLKEQFLSLADQAGYEIVVCDLGRRATSRIRTRSDLLEASALACGRNGTNGYLCHAIVSRSVYGVHCVCPGASVADDAMILDSIIMPGARVGSGAVVARSVLFRDAVVDAGGSVVERCVSRIGSFTDSDIESRKGGESWR